MILSHRWSNRALVKKLPATVNSYTAQCTLARTLPSECVQASVDSSPSLQGLSGYLTDDLAPWCRNSKTQNQRVSRGSSPLAAEVRVCSAAHQGWRPKTLCAKAVRGWSADIKPKGASGSLLSTVKAVVPQNQSRQETSIHVHFPQELSG